MTTRLMVWNIQKLGISKFQASADDPNLLRAAYIARTIHVVNPDIFVVVEVQTTKPHDDAGQGYVVSNTSGGPAVLLLLHVLRMNDPPADWRVVPPLLSGSDRRMEGIAVFFKNTKVNFRGPQQIDVGPLDDGVSYGKNGDITTDANGPYPAPWDAALPATPPAGGPVGGQAKNQNQLCGRPFFLDPTYGNWGHHQRLAPMYFPDAGNRSPFLTDFREVGVLHPRTISVLSCHFPPSTFKAGKAIDKVLLIPEMTGPMVADEVRVICGDFNINFNNFYRAAYFMNLVQQNINRPGGTTNYAFRHPRDPSIYKGVRAATLDGTAPYFDVISRGMERRRRRKVLDPGDRQGVDAIFVAYGTDPVPMPNLGEVVNRVVDTPYTGPVQVDQAMQLTARAILQWHSPTPRARDDVLRRIENFGKIRRASDHMPVFADL